MTNKEAIQKASWAYIAGAGKAGKGYAIKPSDGSGDFTFSRPDGVNQTGVKNAIDPSGRLVSYPANVPAVNYQLNPNLLLHTEEFDNAVWVKNGLNTTGTPPWVNVAVAPDGTLTAEKIIPTTDNVFHFLEQQAITITAVKHARSVFAKAGGYRYLTIRYSSPDAHAVFDLENGLVTQESANVSGIIEPSSDGWYRCTLIDNNTATSKPFQIGISNTPTPANTTPTFAGDGTSGIFISKAQLVEGSQPLKYHRNDSFRRYIPQGLWIEPSATNLLQWSEEFDNIYWTKSNATITANSTVAPDGTTTADTFTANTNATAQIWSPIIGAGTRTLSIHVKQTNAWLAMLFWNGVGTSGARLWFNCATGTIGTTNADGPQFSVVGSRVTKIGEYYRVKFTVNATIDHRANLRIVDGNSSFNSTAVVITPIVIWGAQLEAGSVATSYIKTEATPVTRPADVATITDASDLIGQTEGTVLVEVDVTSAGNENASGILTLAQTVGNDNNNRVIITKSPNAKRFTYQIRQNNTVLFSQETSTDWTDGKNKIGVVYSNGRNALFVNGVLAFDNTLVPNFSETLSVIKLGYYTSAQSFYINDFISQAIIFKQALSDTEVQNWTTL